MIYQILSVKDRMADAYGRPIFVPSIGVAIRSFQDELNRAADDNTMYKHPDDHDLYHIGTFDDDTGKLTSIEPTQVAIGKQLANR